MSLKTYEKNAIKYYVDDIGSSLLPSTPLSNVLKILEENQKPVSKVLLKYIEKKSLTALTAYLQKECSFEEYVKKAKIEKLTRVNVVREETRLQEKIQAENELKWKLEAEKRIKEQKEKQRRREKDPKYIAKVKQNKLREKYNLTEFIDREYFPRIMKILQNIDNDLRLTEKDAVWLNMEGKDYYTPILQKAFHEIEANFYANEFKIKNDPWLVVNASSHYRKADKATLADELIHKINITKFKNTKLKSALYTTHGGTKRDLGEKDLAITLADKAHKIAPKDFRPCTLLGAVNIELGAYEEGQAWYAKAIENGFSEKAMDSELKRIYFRLSKSEKESLRTHLIKMDKARYKWAI